MYINYIILAHKNPEQVFRLVKRLDEPWTRFYLHVDSNVDIEPFQKIFTSLSHVFLLEEELREAGTWGDLGLVKATINGMAQIIKNKKSGYCILLSGQDYPLFNNSAIRNFFSDNNGSQFITSYPLPNEKLTNGGLSRINKYKVNKSHQRGHFLFLPTVFEKEFYSIETAGKLNFLRKNGKFRAMTRVFFKRRFPKYLKPYAGSQWWALSTDIVQRIIVFIKEHPDYLDYHKYSLIPDEMFFQSILMQLQKSNDFQIERSLTYVNWERKSGPLPVTFELRDWQELIKVSENYLFARKFDISMDSTILDKIDAELIED